MCPRGRDPRTVISVSLKIAKVGVKQQSPTHRFIRTCCTLLFNFVLFDEDRHYRLNLSHRNKIYHHLSLIGDI